MLDEINNTQTTADKENDIIGHVYEYFLTKFALQEGTSTTYKMAKMNHAIREIPCDLGEKASDTFTNDLHKDLRADFIMANSFDRKGKGMKQNCRKRGKIVKLVNERNKSLVSTDVLGISIAKEFMPSIANTIGTDLSNYKVLKKNRFACNPMYVGRDERLPISLYHKDSSAIVFSCIFYV